MRLTNLVNDYIEKGLRPIPIYLRSKLPIGNNWNKRWSAYAARLSFKRLDECNIGTLLGNVIDVEGDTADANVFLNTELNKYNHPIYKSHKSYHHLFLNPFPELTRVVVGGIEFRANKHQSLLPPSTHPTGAKYEWVRPLGDIPLLPDELVDLLVKNNCLNFKSKQDIFESPYCQKCRKQVRIKRDRFNLELSVFKSLGQGWRCNRCRELAVRVKLSKPVVLSQKANVQKVDSKRNCLLKLNLESHRRLISILNNLKMYYGSIFKYKEYKALYVEGDISDYFYIDFFIYNFRLGIRINSNGSVLDNLRAAFLNKNKYDILELRNDDLKRPHYVMKSIVDLCLTHRSKHSELLAQKIDELPLSSLDLPHF